MRVYIPAMIAIDVDRDDDPVAEVLATVRQLHELNNSFEGVTILVDERSEVRDTVKFGPMFYMPVPVDDDRWHDEPIAMAGCMVVNT